MRSVRAAASLIPLLSFSLSASHVESFIIAPGIETYFDYFRFPPPPLSSSTHLHAGLGEIDFQRHFFAHEYIRVARFGKQRLQNVELRARKSSPLSSLLPRRRCG